MLIIHESLMRFRALLSANNHKIYDLLPSKVSLYYIIFLLREELPVSIHCHALCVKTTTIRPKGSIVLKTCIIQVTKVLDFVDLRT